MVPPELAERLGDEILLQIIAREGAPCADPAGRRALAKLLARAAGDDAAEVHVVGLGEGAAALLPGQLLLIDRGRVGAAASPEEVAAWIALALAEAEAHPPIPALLAASPLSASLRLLVTGRLGDATLGDAAARTMAPPAPSPATLAAASRRLEAAAVPAAALDAALRRPGLAADAPAPDAAPSPTRNGSRCRRSATDMAESGWRRKATNSGFPTSGHFPAGHR